MKESTTDFISVYSCDELPYAIKSNINDDYFGLAADSINCRKGAFFTDLDAAKKYLNRKGRTHGLHEVTLPKQFFMEENNQINSDHKVKAVDIKRLHLSPYYFNENLTSTLNTKYFDNNKIIPAEGAENNTINSNGLSKQS